jgi:hypothetical protein
MPQTVLKLCFASSVPDVRLFRVTVDNVVMQKGESLLQQLKSDCLGQHVHNPRVTHRIVMSKVGMPAGTDWLAGSAAGNPYPQLLLPLREIRQRRYKVTRSLSIQCDLRDQLNNISCISPSMVGGED